MLQLSTKCCTSAFNAGGSRLIIVVVQVGAVKIYGSSSGEALMKKERQDEIPSLPIKELGVTTYYYLILITSKLCLLASTMRLNIIAT
jgi:hypothetical protein